MNIRMLLEQPSQGLIEVCFRVSALKMLGESRQGSARPGLVEMYSTLKLPYRYLPRILLVIWLLVLYLGYQESLRSTYPSLIVPASFPWTETIVSANPSRPVYTVQYSDSTRMDCLLP